MKKWLLALIILAISPSLKAQSNVAHPFPTDSAAWYDISKRHNFPFEPYFENAKFYINGDTSINNTGFKRISHKRRYYDGFYTHSAIRVDSNKVYVKYFNATVPVDTGVHVLYNYNLQVGNSFATGFDNISFVCVSIDSAITNTGYRKQWNLLFNGECSTLPQLDTLKWIEGATSNLGLFYDLFFADCFSTDIEVDNRTECFMHRDTFVLGGGFAGCEYLLNDIEDEQQQPNISIFPNPATADFTIEVDNLTQNLAVQLYNSLGQQVGSYSAVGNQLTIPRNNLPGGVYIVQVQAGQRVIRHKVLFIN
ncbi:MAG: T9SS type A sorting domain-containing protein [Sphingobacteriales bacterium JAD_PAG50586_3]|nr:MAG: T9SS type A sorting domain-containing protein [Sphingobacteriales bacterium JAD_PAG50586_3]